MKKPSGIKITLLFSIIFFFIQTVGSFFMPIFTIIFLQSGIIKEPNFVLFSIQTAIMSVIVGTVLASIVSSRVLRPITDLNEAAKKIAKGEFDVHIKEIGIGKEIYEMTKSFNIMVDELKNTETFRNDFIANVSHEFKTPISAIEGYATLLQDKSLSEEERDDYVERILTSSKRLSSLSGNILLISKLENQEIVPDKIKYCLDEQVRGVILSLENLWSEKNLDLDIDMDDNITFYGNKSIVSHIWFNIFSNAIKFTPSGGFISVKMYLKGNNIVTEIADNGVGMSEETLKHIFEKFYCDDKSRENSGNGLGLTLAKRAAELCGGSIKVESEKNIGSKFTVILPKE